jgi:lysozyme
MTDGGGGMRLLLLVALGVIVLILAAPSLYERFELAAMGYAVKGVDVSHHQGEIDWRALRASGVRFADIKATEGVRFRDPRFAENWRRSREAGIPRGAYHYFSMCLPGAKQAANFIAATPVEAGSLPHALDVEQMEPCPRGKRVANPAAEITAFLNAVEKRFGRRPLIYTNRDFHQAHLEGRLQNERFWLASLNHLPSFRSQHWTLWQYHQDGRRRGVDGPVDLNAFNGSRAEFEKFASPSPTPSPAT